MLNQITMFFTISALKWTVFVRFRELGAKSATKTLQ